MPRNIYAEAQWRTLIPGPPMPGRLFDEIGIPQVDSIDRWSMRQGFERSVDRQLPGLSLGVS
jgi:hypothetical protein